MVNRDYAYNLYYGLLVLSFLSCIAQSLLLLFAYSHRNRAKQLHLGILKHNLTTLAISETTRLVMHISLFITLGIPILSLHWMKAQTFFKVHPYIYTNIIIGGIGIIPVLVIINAIIEWRRLRSERKLLEKRHATSAQNS
jgi:hypothetical protein